VVQCLGATVWANEGVSCTLALPTGPKGVTARWCLGATVWTIKVVLCTLAIRAVGLGRAVGLRYCLRATDGLWGPGRAWGLRYRLGATVGLGGPDEILT
jgi:hypothetical protein